MNVQGTHVYTKPGEFDITVTVIKSWIGLSPVRTPDVRIATIDSQAIVAPAVGNGGVTLAEIAGTQFTAHVGQFIALAGSNYTGTINWGDGSTSTAKLV